MIIYTNTHTHIIYKRYIIDLSLYIHIYIYCYIYTRCFPRIPMSPSLRCADLTPSGRRLPPWRTLHFGLWPLWPLWPVAETIGEGRKGKRRAGMVINNGSLLFIIITIVSSQWLLLVVNYSSLMVINGWQWWTIVHNCWSPLYNHHC